MSYPFAAADGSGLLWDPGIGVGRTFVALAGQTGDLLGVPTGLMRNDRIGGSDVDMVVFQRFTQTLYDQYCNTNNFVLHGIWRGLLLPSIVIVERGGGLIKRKPDEEYGLFEERDAYVRAMWVED
ncbi:DUF6086 family protein [Streptomyces sp. SBR177]